MEVKKSLTKVKFFSIKLALFVILNERTILMINLNYKLKLF